jgi:hypothetical protein
MTSLSFAELIPGYEFPSSIYELDNAIISKYLKAVESPAQEYALYMHPRNLNSFYRYLLELQSHATPE